MASIESEVTLPDNIMEQKLYKFAADSYLMQCKCWSQYDQDIWYDENGEKVLVIAEGPYRSTFSELVLMAEAGLKMTIADRVDVVRVTMNPDRETFKIEHLFNILPREELSDDQDEMRDMPDVLPDQE